LLTVGELFEFVDDLAGAVQVAVGEGVQLFAFAVEGFVQVEAAGAFT
jgi:hypothetical protein